MLALAAWEPNEIITLVSILATAVIGVATIVTNHSRETNLHRRTLEAERAKPYRESALDVVAYARDATYACRDVISSPLPTTSDEVTTLLAHFEPASRALVLADQTAVRIATLGWSKSVRSVARELYHLLLKLNAQLSVTRAIAEGRIAPAESPSIAAGDSGFWSRWHADMTDAIESIEQKTREYEDAIGE